MNIVCCKELNEIIRRQGQVPDGMKNRAVSLKDACFYQKLPLKQKITIPAFSQEWQGSGKGSVRRHDMLVLAPKQSLARLKV